MAVGCNRSIAFIRSCFATFGGPFVFLIPTHLIVMPMLLPNPPLPFLRVFGAMNDPSRSVTPQQTPGRPFSSPRPTAHWLLGSN